MNTHMSLLPREAQSKSAFSKASIETPVKNTAQEGSIADVEPKSAKVVVRSCKYSMQGQSRKIRHFSTKVDAVHAYHL